MKLAPQLVLASYLKAVSVCAFVSVYGGLVLEEKKKITFSMIRLVSITFHTVFCVSGHTVS